MKLPAQSKGGIFMADTQNLTISKQDWNGAYVPKHTAKLIKAGIENETAPFLPKPQDIVRNGETSLTFKMSPELIYNANTGFALDAKDMIPVLLTKAEKGYESNVVGTKKSMDNAKTSIKADEKGVWYNFKGKNGEFHHSAYFFPEQAEQPERLKEFAQGNIKQKQNLSNETIKIESADATEYLAAYVAACKSGAKVEVSPEIAEQFKQNILAVADNELVKTNAMKNPNIPKMTDLLSNVEKRASEIVKSREKELGIGQEQKAQGFKPKENKRKPVEMSR